MTHTSRQAEHLDHLSTALTDGTDLVSILAVLIDDLVAAVPSFLGLRMTLPTSGGPGVVSTLTPSMTPMIRASLTIRLDTVGAACAGGAVVYYAATAGAFEELAAMTRQHVQRDDAVVLDAHLDPDVAVGTALVDLSLIDQAIGMLIEQGYTPESARTTIDERSSATGRPPLAVAVEITSGHLDDEKT
jgi:hypothetical protein